MASFGERLRKEREQRGITLDDVSLSTKIGTRMLRALEEEQFDQLPGGIFNKGFVRAYARHLGIDEQQAVTDYLEAAGESISVSKIEATAQAPAERPKPVAPPPELGRQDSAAANLPWGKLAIVLLLVALGLSLWSYHTRETAPKTTERRPVTTSPGPTESASPASPQTSAPGQNADSLPAETRSEGQEAPAALPSSASPAPETGSSHAPAGGSEPASTPAPITTVPAKSPLSTMATKAPLTPASATAPQEPPVPPGFFVVQVTADDDCWLSITADGKTATETTLIAPARKSIQAQKQIVIRAGNVGALTFFFNGKRLPVQGEEGQVKTLVFGADGLRPPAPKPPG